MDNTMIIVKSHENTGLQVKGVSETIKNDVKNKKVYFLPCYYGDSLLGNTFTGKEATARRASTGTMRDGEGTIRVRQGFQFRLIL